MAVNGDRLPILVVEDEFLIALDIQQALRDFGFSNVEIAAGLKDALALADRGPLATALLDINIGGTRSFAVAEVLQRHAVPFAFLTGYDDQVVPEQFASAPVLKKPFSRHELAGVLRALGLSPQSV